MATWRSLGVLLVFLAVTATGRAQTCNLTEKPQENECYHYHLDMKLSGAMRVHREDQVVPIPLAATASHDFVERILAVLDESSAHGLFPERLADRRGRRYRN